MGLGIVKVEPALRLRAGVRVKADEFTYAQAAAVEQLNHALVAQFLPVCVTLGAGGFVGCAVAYGAACCCAGAVVSQLHGGIYWQGFGQEFGGFGGAYAFNRVVLHVPRHDQPAVKPPPA